MAKKAMIEREKKREKLVAKYAAKRAELKAIVSDESKPMEERFRASLKLAKLPRNSSAVRLHNRCQLTGRPHAYYRKLKISRIALRRRLQSHTPLAASTRNSTLARKTMPRATRHGTCIPRQTVKVKKAFIPIPGASAIG